jgi:hypothetical protein
MEERRKFWWEDVRSVWEIGNKGLLWANIKGKVLGEGN